jgi:(p)ppGpp synthase/HD superfamily hydrolase
MDPELFILDANHFASDAHRGQFRKYTRDPYIVHPEKVATLVRYVTGDTETIAAAWLHDVVEDCGVSIERLDTLFGHAVALLVSDVTNVSRPEDGNRARRKAIERAHLGFANPRAKTIKLADIVDNVPSVVTHDPMFAKTYVREKWMLLPYLRGGDASLWDHVRSVLYRALTYDLGIDTNTIKHDFGVLQP